MKQLFFILITLLIGGVGSAQTASPVSWSYSSKKLSNDMYELQMTATIQTGWHVYSQSQPKDAIAQPTSFKFNNNPLVQLDGSVAEVGKVEKFTDKELGVSANQYSKQVVFTQKIKLKAKVKSNVGGTVTYQTCNDQKCLPPKTVAFNVALK